MDLNKIESFIRKQKVAYICSVDEEGFPNVKAMLKPRKMEVLTDQDTKDMIWRKGDTMFYKGGVTDPDYCVLRFTAENGKYYCDLKTESFTIE